MYAYPEGMDGQVDIEAKLVGDNSLVFVLSDSGKAFDPTATAEVNVSAGVDERRIGGLGIHLVRSVMDSVRYQRKGGKNILTMTKNI
jgi:sigma-B regulation protein RsbU (phosphoserine phosphatase)